MERLRRHAIDHSAGFILDAKIRPASGDGRDRWMRLIGSPLCENGRTVGLYGLKLAL
jgi:hypothetical protein